MSRLFGTSALDVSRIVSPMVLGSDTRVVQNPANLSGQTPRISAGIFCDTPAAETAWKAALHDRRLARVTPKFLRGGITAAIATHSLLPTPDLLIVETTADGDGILAGLDRLSGVCDADTKVIVIGRPNDIALYRAIIAKGVSEYLVGPIDNLSAIAAVLGLYRSDTPARVGRICAFLGAKGGVGSSTLAQNVALQMAEDRRGPVMLVDLDLQFGSAALNLNLMPSAGFHEQTMDVERLDEALLERTLVQKGKYLHVLPASGRLQEIDAPNPEAVEKLLDLSRQAFPMVVLDLPHLQSPWMKTVLAAVDDLVIVAAPDLANLRNAKCLLDIFRQTRPNDPAPRVVLNQVGISKNGGISPADFASGLQVKIDTQLPFDPRLFAKAADDGRLIAETAPRSAAGRALAALASQIAARPVTAMDPAPNRRSFFRVPWRSASA